MIIRGTSSQIWILNGDPVILRSVIRTDSQKQKSVIAIIFCMASRHLIFRTGSWPQNQITGMVNQKALSAPTITMAI